MFGELSQKSCLLLNLSNKLILVIIDSQFFIDYYFEVLGTSIIFRRLI